MKILETWNRLQKLPGGKFLFSRLLGRWVPYTGSLKAEVVALGPGYAKVLLKDKPHVRNHLSSIHAAALMNFAEATTGLAFTAGAPADARAILVRFEIDYLKKARGTLTGECEAPVPSTNEEKEFEVGCEVKDQAGEVVARARAKWLVGPMKK